MGACDYSIYLGMSSRLRKFQCIFQNQCQQGSLVISSFDHETAGDKNEIIVLVFTCLCKLSTYYAIFLIGHSTFPLVLVEYAD